MSFDTFIERRGSHAAKWDKLTAFSGVSPDTGLAMWVADSDYASAPCVIEALRSYAEHAIYGYGFDDDGYRAAICDWQARRHGWQMEPDWISTTQGLGHAIAMIFDTFSEIGDGVCYFTPVYHEFRQKTLRAERRPVELPMALVDGRYQLDFDAAQAAIDPGVKILLFCSPQNPSGRVWTAEEQRQVAEFAKTHNLILVSDEIHADLTYAPAKHVPMDMAAPQYRDRTITITAASKTFNIPGLRTGQAIIPDQALRAAFQRRITMTEYAPGTPGVVATIAAYSDAGAAWADAQLAYLTENRRVFDEGINAIPGVWSMPLEATFLAWVDFSGTGMESDEVVRRIRDDAKIGVSLGPSFGTGGESFHRFNLAMPRAQIEDAVSRMQKAFADLQ